MATPEEIAKITERLVRWEDKRREQLGVTNNVIMGMAIGLIGFLSAFLKPLTANDKFDCALFLICSSVFCGLAGTLTRLYDYKFTADKIRLDKKELEGKGIFTSEKKELKDEASRLGWWTWFMLWMQILAFIFGSIFVYIYVTTLNDASP